MLIERVLHFKPQLFYMGFSFENFSFYLSMPKHEGLKTKFLFFGLDIELFFTYHFF